MEPIFLPAHFDGTHIQLNQPFDIPANSRLVVAVLPADNTERNAWLGVSVQGLQRVCNDDEPEYNFSDLKFINPAFTRL